MDVTMVSACWMRLTKHMAAEGYSTDYVDDARRLVDWACERRPSWGGWDDAFEEVAERWHEGNGKTRSRMERHLWHLMLLAEHGELPRPAFASVLEAYERSEAAARKKPGTVAGETRRAGGGRKSRAEKDPGLAQPVLDYVDGSTYGDPMCDVAHATKSVRNVADAVEAATGESISHETVRSVLREGRYSPEGNRKCLQVGKPHPDRDGQISPVSERTCWYVGEGLPAISIDAKKKELLGNYRNGGREWSAKGAHTDVPGHDFMDKGLGKAVPYGVYDIGANEGYAGVGNSADTAEFCASTSRAWWD